MSRENITNDKYITEYQKILSGIGQPELIDKMIYQRHDQRNCSPKIQDMFLNKAWMIKKAWIEEAIHDMILRMSWHILHLEEELKRNNIDFSPYMSYYTMPPEDGNSKCEQ